jgi:hypothetical protein
MPVLYLQLTHSFIKVSLPLDKIPGPDRFHRGSMKEQQSFTIIVKAKSKQVITGNQYIHYILGALQSGS